MNLNEIKLNHSELGYLMDISSAYSKEIICTCLEKDKVGVKDWSEDGTAGEIQLKTPIAWHRVLRIAEEIDKKQNKAT